MVENKNLRNYFIQSSLTFNGNNLNSNSNKKNSALGSMSMYDGQHTNMTHLSGAEDSQLQNRHFVNEYDQVNQSE